METTIILAQLWGWFTVISCALFLLRSTTLLEKVFRVVDDTRFTFLSGYLALVLGLVTVILHNVWSVDWRIIVTLFGWLALLKGVALIGFPKIAQDTTAVLKDRPVVVRVVLLVALLLGAWLIIMSY